MSGGILLVEDDMSLRRAVSLKLSKEGYCVYTAGSVREAWDIYDADAVSLIICDIGLPDGSGLEFCEKVRRREKSEKSGDMSLFLFLTALDSETDMINGYEAGCDDYVTKPFSLAVLISKVRAMMSRYGETSYKDKAEMLIRSGDVVMYVDKNRAEKRGKCLNLTATEQKILLYFMENPMKVLSKSQLLEAIWDIDGNFIDDNTIAVNIRRLREKIEDDPSSPAVIKNIRGLGYVWERECEKN